MFVAVQCFLSYSIICKNRFPVFVRTTKYNGSHCCTCQMYTVNFISQPRQHNASNVDWRRWLFFSPVQSNSLFLSIHKGAGGNRLSFSRLNLWHVCLPYSQHLPPVHEYSPITPLAEENTCRVNWSTPPRFPESGKLIPLPFYYARPLPSHCWFFFRDFFSSR